MKKFSVVVPCYNEEKNIPLIFERFNQSIGQSDIEVVLVNNGSTDNSAQVLKNLSSKFPWSKIVSVEKNIGYGHGIVEGLKNCSGEFLGWTHADMQTDPLDVIKGLELIGNARDPEKTYVKGLRKGRPFFDEFFTLGMSLFESCYLKSSLYDINAQPNIFHKSFFEKWKGPPNDFSLDLYAYYLANRCGLKILKLKVLFPERLHGTSHWNTGLLAKWKFIKRTLTFSKKLKRELMNGIYCTQN